MKLRQAREPGLHFRRQSPVSAYVVDFECRRQKLIVDVDGGRHGFEGNIASDRERDRILESVGHRVLRFWSNQIDGELEGVIEIILAALAKDSPPGSLRSPPSPRGEGE